MCLYGVFPIERSSCRGGDNVGGESLDRQGHVRTERGTSEGAFAEQVVEQLVDRRVSQLVDREIERFSRY